MPPCSRRAGGRASVSGHRLAQHLMKGFTNSEDLPAAYKQLSKMERAGILPDEISFHKQHQLGSRQGQLKVGLGCHWNDEGDAPRPGASRRGSRSGSSSRTWVSCVRTYERLCSDSPSRCTTMRSLTRWALAAWRAPPNTSGASGPLPSSSGTSTSCVFNAPWFAVPPIP